MGKHLCVSFEISGDSSNETQRLYIHFQDREAVVQAHPGFNFLTEQHKQKEHWEKRTPHTLCWPLAIGADELSSFVKCAIMLSEEYATPKSC